MNNYRNIGLYFLNIMLLIVIPISVIPNLSDDLKNYKSKTKILQSTRIDEKEYIKNFTKRVRKTFVLKMTDGTEVKLTTHKKCWKEIQSEKNLGKKVKYYLAKHRSSGMNPIQLEIENKIIYDPSEIAKWNYIIILLTIALTIYSAIKIRNYFQYKNE